MVSSLEHEEADPVGLVADAGEVGTGHVERPVVAVAVVEEEVLAMTVVVAAAAAAVGDVAETAAASVAAQEAVADQQLTCPALAPSGEHGLEAALQSCCEGHEACSCLVKLQIR